MIQREHPVRTHDGPVEAALAEYFTRLDRDESVDITQLFAAYPGCEAGLRQFLNQERKLKQAVVETPPAATPPEHLAGRALGDYRILRELGRGGMGVVYEAEQLSLGRRVAIKVLPFAAMLGKQQLTRFKIEARAAATLDHPNIVAIYSVGSEGDVHYYAMQLIDGQSLAQVIATLRRNNSPLLPNVEKSPGDGIRSTDAEQRTTDCTGLPQTEVHDPRPILPLPLSSRDACPPTHISTLPEFQSREYYRSIARQSIQAAEALDHAHQNGIVHRDIKPGNLLLDAEGKLYVTDFGLARIEADAGMTMTGDIIGTLRYMAPEQALAKRVVVDHRSDIYSLGVTLYELLTLQPAFTGDDRQTLLHQIALEEPRKPREISPRIPTDLETIVLKAIEKNPTDRYATCQQLADDLRRFLEHQTITARRPNLRQRFTKWSRRNRPVVVSAGISAAAIIVASMTILVLSNTQIRKESAAKEIALKEKDAALTMARKAVEQMLIRVAEGQLKDLPAAAHIRQAVLEDAIQILQIYDGFSKDGKLDRGLRKDRASVLIIISGIQREFGRYEDSLRSCDQGIQFLQELVTENPKDPDLRMELAAYLAHQAVTWSMTPPGPNTQQVDELCHKAITIYDDLERDWPEVPQAMGVPLSYLAKSAQQRGDVIEAERLHREAIERDEMYLEYARQRRPVEPTGDQTLFGSDKKLINRSAVENAHLNLCWAYAGLANLLKEEQRTAEFETLFQKGLQHAAILVHDNPRSALGRQPTASLMHMLAEWYSSTGRKEEALGLYRQAIDVIHWLCENCPQNAWNWETAGYIHYNMMNIEYQRGGIGEVRDTSRQILHWIAEVTSLVPNEQETQSEIAQCRSQIHRLLGTWTAEGGSWKEAIDEFGHFVTETPDQTYAFSYIALARLQLSDHEGYRSTCTHVVQQFDTSANDPARDFWLAWTCALGPDGLDDFDVPLKYARQLVAKHPNDASALSALAILNYRAGQYDEAAKRLAESIAACAADSSGDGTVIYPQLFLAMTQWRLGNELESRRLLAESQVAIDEAMKSSLRWNRRATLTLLRREAETLLSSGPDGPDQKVIDEPSSAEE